MNVLISNFEKKKKKLEKLDNLAKKLVSNCTEFNINLQKCKPVLSEPMTTTILYNVIELKQNDNMKFYNDSMKLKKKRLMNN